MLPAIIATTVTTPSSTRGFTLTAGGLDVTPDTAYDGLTIEDGGGEAATVTNLRVTRDWNAVPEIRDQAVLEITDHLDSHRTAFRGLIDSRHPARYPAKGYVDVAATGIGQLLENVVPLERRPVESDRARIGFFWGYYAGSYLPADLSQVQAVNGALPAQTFEGLMLSEVLDLITAQASSSAWWYLEANGRLHYGTAETNNAPKNITTDAPGGGEVGPQFLDADWDSGSFAQAVYVRGKTAAGSGWVRSEAAKLNYNRLVKTAFLDAPDCATAAMRDALGTMFLGRVGTANLRGTFGVTSVESDGWRTGQNVVVRSTHLGISSVSYRIVSVTETVLGPYLGITAGMRRYEVQFNRVNRGKRTTH